MITLFILGLAASVLILAALPVVGFALMLETSAQRVAAPPLPLVAQALRAMDDEEAPITLRPGFGFS
jgi:hypothetical protein